jgi:FtsH-binding integral membrane protein
MKRLLWTVAMAVGGFALGWQDQGGRLEPQHVLMITVWFASIGFGFGSIFAKRRPRKGLFVFYWAFTLGLMAMIFSGFVPVANLPTQVAVAGTIGALLGLIVGVAQVKLSSSWRTAQRLAAVELFLSC